MPQQTAGDKAASILASIMATRGTTWERAIADPELICEGAAYYARRFAITGAPTVTETPTVRLPAGEAWLGKAAID